MSTLNNQLIGLKAEVDDKVLGDGWTGLVFMNEFGLGVSMITSHDPRALCDGIFPPMRILRLIKKKGE